jgi:protein TonB
MLVSFFRRFHDQVELVWNYPAVAARNGIEGILELLIIVDRKGELIDVDLLHSSGSDILDYEAIQAIYRAAPFGPLTKHYPHPQLKMHVYFRYTLGGKSIYGQ